MVKRRIALCALIAAILFILPGACSKPCDYAVLSETKSPNQKLKAVVFETDCSPANGSSTQISILNSSTSSPGERGNLFSVCSSDGAALDKMRAAQVEVIWESDSSLLISYPKTAQVIQKKPSVAGIAVRYEAVP